MCVCVCGCTLPEQAAYHSELLVMRLPEGLCPPHFARVSFLLERFVAFGTTKSEGLHKCTDNSTVKVSTYRTIG